MLACAVAGDALGLIHLAISFAPYLPFSSVNSFIELLVQSNTAKENPVVKMHNQVTPPLVDGRGYLPPPAKVVCCG